MLVPYTKSGVRLKGTLEVVCGIALVEGIEDGEPVYEGTTEIDWDSQKTVRRRGQRVWVDDDGYEYLERQVVFREEDEVTDLAA